MASGEEVTMAEMALATRMMLLGEEHIYRGAVGGVRAVYITEESADQLKALQPVLSTVGVECKIVEHPKLGQAVLLVGDENIGRLGQFYLYDYEAMSPVPGEEEKPMPRAAVKRILPIVHILQDTPSTEIGDVDLQTSKAFSLKITSSLQMQLQRLMNAAVTMEQTDAQSIRDALLMLGPSIDNVYMSRWERIAQVESLGHVVDALCNDPAALLEVAQNGDAQQAIFTRCAAHYADFNDAVLNNEGRAGRVKTTTPQDRAKHYWSTPGHQRQFTPDIDDTMIFAGVRLRNH